MVYLQKQPVLIHHLTKRRTYDWLLLMDTDMETDLRGLLCIGTTKKPPDEPATLTYNSETEDVVKTTVLEAAKRLSHSRSVVVVSEDPCVQACVGTLSEMAYATYGQGSRRLRCISPNNEGSEVTDDDCVMSVDADCYRHPRLICSVMRCPELDTLRVLLVGKTGSGKSSTGNTLLGEERFGTKLSFGPVTMSPQTNTATHCGTKLEVVDSQGIIRLYKKFQQECAYAENASEWFHVIVYVMKMGRFTEEELEVFRRIQDMYGDEVAQHIIIIFTYGDDINPENIEDRYLRSMEGVEPERSVDMEPDSTVDMDSGSAVDMEPDSMEDMEPDSMEDMKPKSFEDKKPGIIEKLVEKAPPKMKQLLKECGGRYVVFNNKEKEDKTQVKTFLAMARKLVDSKSKAHKLFRCPPVNVIEKRWEQARRGRRTVSGARG